MAGFIAFLTLVFAATVMMNVSAHAASAAEKRRALVAERAATRDYARRSNDEYAARAQSRDPSGDYKGYPNWARAALGAGGPTRGGR
jgi:hypothetical protein